MRFAGLCVLLVGCGSPADRCVDPAVCDAVMAKYEIEDFHRRASAVFAHEGVSYHLIEVRWPSEGQPELGPSANGLCEIWNVGAGSGALFQAGMHDFVDFMRYVAPWCGEVWGGANCDWPGYESPLVEAPEFRNYGARQGFMKGCREVILQAQAAGRIPGPIEPE